MFVIGSQSLTRGRSDKYGSIMPVDAEIANTLFSDIASNKNTRIKVDASVIK
jgi:hypothetical protein